MCEALEQIINEKLDAREARGKLEGERLERQRTVRKLRMFNFPLEQIANIVEESMETVEAWLAEN